MFTSYMTCAPSQVKNFYFLYKKIVYASFFNAFMSFKKFKFK